MNFKNCWTILSVGMKINSSKGMSRNWPERE
jgi:hypothetical protein